MQSKEAGPERASLATTQLDTQTIHALVVSQDMARLTPAQQVAYYLQLCDATGLDPRTKPFALINMNGRLVPYALKAATDQLRARRNLSITVTKRERIDDLYTVEVSITDGRRQDTELGAVPVGGLKGDALANALMKALTKAKRRATLSFCGLGMLDESELDTIPNARPAPMPDINVVSAEPAAEGPDPWDQQVSDMRQVADAEMKHKPWRKLTDGTSERDAYQFRWARLVDKARALGIDVELLPEWASRSMYETAAKGVQGAIEEKEAEIRLSEDESEAGNDNGQ